MKVTMIRINDQIIGITSLKDGIKSKNIQKLLKLKIDYEKLINNLKRLYNQYQKNKNVILIWEMSKKLNEFINKYSKMDMEFRNLFSFINKDLGISDYTLKNIKKFAIVYPDKKKLKYPFGLYSELLLLSSETARKELERKLENGEIPAKTTIIRKLRVEKNMELKREKIMNKEI